MYRVLLEIRFYVSISFLLLFLKEIVAKIAPDIAPIKVVKIALHAANDVASYCIVEIWFIKKGEYICGSDL